MRIFRYALAITDHQVLDLPMSARPLSVAPSRTLGELSLDLWALVPEEAPTVPVSIYIVGTGNPMPEFPATLAAREVRGIVGVAGMFLGTAVMPSGLVWHVFWRDGE